MRDAEDSFEDLKKFLISAPILKSPDFSLQFKLYSDASNYGIGSVLAQESEDSESVIAYASRLLRPSKIKYGVLQKEALGIVWSLSLWSSFHCGNRPSPLEVVEHNDCTK